MAELRSSLWKHWWSVEKDEDTTFVLTDARVTKGRASSAYLAIGCVEDLRSPAVYIAFNFEEPPSGTPTSRPAYVAQQTAEARRERAAERAQAAEDSIDQIFISRRNFGEAGRWMKTGWKHY